MSEGSSSATRHTTPTHLFLPDKLLFGFTTRQLLLLLIGGLLSYGLWLQLGDLIPAGWGSLGTSLRIVGTLPPALLCLLLAFVTVAGRPLELWGMVWLQFISQPKTAVWRRTSVQNHPAPATRHASVQAQLPVHALLHDSVELVPAARGGKPIYAAILRVQASSFSLMSREEQHALTQGYRALLLALRFPIQILVRAGRMKLSSYVSRLPDPGNLTAERAVPVPSSRLPLALAHARAIRELEQQRTLLSRRCYLVVSSEGEPPVASLTRFPLLLAWLSGRSRSQQQRQARRLLEMRVAALIDLLAEMGLVGEQLTGEGLLTLFDECLRGEAAVQRPFTSAHLAPPFITTNAFQQPDPLAPEALFSPVRASDEDEEPNDWDEEEEHETWNDEGEETDALVLSNSVLDQLAPTALLIARDHVQVGDDYLAGMAVTGLPREISEGALAPLLHQEELMDLTLHLRPLASAPVLRRLTREQAQYRSTERLAQRRGTPSDPDLTIAEQDTTWLIPALASGEERLLEVGLYVQVRASSLPALHDRTERLLSTLHNSLLTAHKTTLEHWQTFQAVLPTGRDALGRPLTTTSTALSALLPFPEEALSMVDSGVFVGVTPSGEPILLDPWGPGMDNPHEFWGGISGAGKSFAVKLRIIHETLVRPDLQVIVIDPAGEYRRVAQALGGQSMRIAPGSAQSINPFDLLPAGMDMEQYVQEQRGDRLAEKIHNLHIFLDILLSDYTPQPTVLSAQEKSLLDKVLYECYRRVGITADPHTHHRPAPLLRDVSAVLSEGSMGTDTTGLASRLDRFVSGSLAGLFAHPTNVQLDAPVVAFDLREMRGSSELKPAGIFLISEFLWTQALFHKRPRRCYIDEAWSLIEHEAGGQFLERMAREFRKHYVSLITITQNPEQFITDPRGSVIAQNAYTKVLKRLDPIGSRAARTAFSLSEAEEQRLTHLPQNKALLLVGSKRLLVEMRATPEEYHLCQTDPNAPESNRPSLLTRQASPLPQTPQPLEEVSTGKQTPVEDEQSGARIRPMTEEAGTAQPAEAGETNGQPEQTEQHPPSPPKRAPRGRKKAASSPSRPQENSQQGASL